MKIWGGVGYVDLKWSGFSCFLWDVIWCWEEVEWFICVVVIIEWIEERDWREIGLGM